MAFRFSLAAVLRIREINEQREERLLTQILAQVAQTREALAAVEGQILEAAHWRESALRNSVSAAELHAAYDLAAVLTDRRQFTKEQLRKFEALRDKQIKTYQRAHQDRELLSTMREEQHESFAVEQRRQEQKVVDDMFLARRARH